MINTLHISGRNILILVRPWSWRLMGPPTALYIFFGSWLHLISGGRFFFYSSSTPRTKGKIKSQKSHIENQFIEIIKKWHDFGVKIPKNLKTHTRERAIFIDIHEFWGKFSRMKVLIGLIGLINANLYDQKNIGIRAGNSEPWRHVGRQDKKNTEFGKRFEKVIFIRNSNIFNI